MLARILLPRPPSLLVARHHLSLIHGLRRASTNAIDIPVPAKARPPTSKSARLVGGELQKFQKTELAEQLYENGQRLLYAASWQLTWFRILSYGLGATIVAFLANEMNRGFLDIRENARRGVNNLVIYTQVFVGAFLAAIAGVVFWRAGRNVETIKLVKDVGNVVSIQIRSRGALPFMRRTDLFKPHALEAVPTVNYAPHPIPESLALGPVNTDSRGAMIKGVVSNTPRHVLRGLFWSIGGLKQLFARSAIIDVYGYKGDIPQPMIYFIELHGNYPLPFYQDREPYLFKLLKMQRAAKNELV